MAADVQKNAFMLSSATIMMAPFGTDPFSLIPATHSIGMCKEVSVAVEGDQVELRGGGAAQIVVDSKRTNVRLAISASVFEYTAANMLRALSLATIPIQVRRGALAAAAAAAAVTLSIAADAVPGDTGSDITGIGDIPSGSTLLISRVGAENDYVFPTKSSGVATGVGPYSVPIAAPYVIPTGMSFPIGSKVWVVNDLPVGSIDEQDLFSLKISGVLSNNDRPVTLIVPKVKVNKGFNVSYTETEYGSMPWEFAPLLLSATEATGRLAEIGTRSPAKLYLGA